MALFDDSCEDQLSTVSAEMGTIAHDSAGLHKYSLYVVLGTDIFFLNENSVKKPECLL